MTPNVKSVFQGPSTQYLDRFHARHAHEATTLIFQVLQIAQRALEADISVMVRARDLHITTNLTTVQNVQRDSSLVEEVASPKKPEQTFAACASLGATPSTPVVRPQCRIVRFAHMGGFSLIPPLHFVRNVQLAALEMTTDLLAQHALLDSTN